MDDERLNLILHRKRYILKWNNELDVASRNIFPPEVCRELNSIEPDKRIQFILNNKGFESLISILEATGSGLDQELLSEYKREANHMEVDDSINKECSILVHRTFGKSKIISEAEKKFLQNLLSARVRVMREAYQNHLENINRKLQTQSGKETDLNKMIAEAIFVLSSSVVENLDDGKSDNDQPINHLDICVDRLINLCSSALSERDTLLVEMKSALSELGLSQPESIIQRLKKMNIECSEAAVTDTEKYERIAQLELNIRKIRRESENESRERKKEIDSLQLALNQKVNQNKLLMDKNNFLKEKLRKKGHEMSRINSKLSTVLERSTRLNSQLNKGKPSYLY
ncbi:unnamed protein product [Dimorphilus gyrociliatus]|uniref:Uncharacterized protein n=1 Tax=Dimorphilus gyrociliatus TaxID=2664684 RepID=A0A7I8VGR9_9ANNE|nr:unnamed protein product [Dimorphilus gyrociliatus]